MKLVIENEGDLELGVAYATQLAKEKKKNILTYHFPTDGMLGIFVSHLVTSYIDNDVPVNPNLFLQLICPDEDGYNEELEDEHK
tara:strand:- start:170 stop:421 length:252 start_codon:yes stop_codon:yes gene_type:complete